MKKKYKNFKIGTDAEFLMINPKNGRIIKAGDYFGAGDCIGADANGRTFEVRSLPSENPLFVVNSIKDFFQKFVNNNINFYNYKWVCGSHIKGLPLGMHVHFGMKFNKKYLPYLDNYLGAVSLLLEPRAEGLNRRKYAKSPGGNPVSYGKMGDIREKKWGFEYRPISGCISSPYVLTAMLCLSKVIMFEAINNPSFVPHEFVVAEDFVNMNTDKVRDNFPKIWKDIQSCALYPKYKKYIDLLKALIERRNATWNRNNNDFKQSWGIKDFSKFIEPKKSVFDYEVIPKAKLGNLPPAAVPPVAKDNEWDFEMIWKDLVVA